MQALSKRFHKYGIGSNFNYVLETAFALAHLPASDMEEGMNYLTRIVDEVGEENAEHEKLNKFAAYMRRFWLPLANIFSIYGIPNRTNNTCESFHYHIAQKMGVRPNIWRFLSKKTRIPDIYLIKIRFKGKIYVFADTMEKVMLGYTIDYAKVKKGGRMQLQLPPNVRAADALIIAAESDFAIER